MKPAFYRILPQMITKSYNKVISTNYTVPTFANKKHMRKYPALIIMVLLCPVLLFAQVDITQHIISGRSNSQQQQKKPYVILISADGFRYDLADKYQAKNLQRLRSSGVAAKAMIPSYPSLTFP